MNTITINKYPQITISIGLLLILASLFFVPFSASAEELSVSTFVTKDQAILPNNPFYILKSWTNSFRDLIFSDQPVNKALFRLSYANNQAAEILQARQLQGSSQSQIENYRNALLQWSDSINFLTKENSAQAKSGFENSNQLYAYFLERLIVHERFSQEISATNAELRSALKSSALKLSELMGKETFEEQLQLVRSAQQDYFVDLFLFELLR